ncbi:hypothetical protein ACFLY2_01475 [Patescibacteria group bacterium]
MLENKVEELKENLEKINPPLTPPSNQGGGKSGRINTSIELNI